MRRKKNRNYSYAVITAFVGLIAFTLLFQYQSSSSDAGKIQFRKGNMSIVSGTNTMQNNAMIAQSYNSSTKQSTSTSSVKVSHYPRHSNKTSRPILRKGDNKTQKHTAVNIASNTSYNMRTGRGTQVGMSPSVSCTYVSNLNAPKQGNLGAEEHLQRVSTRAFAVDPRHPGPISSPYFLLIFLVPYVIVKMNKNKA